MSQLLVIFGDKTAEEILGVAQRQYAEKFDKIIKMYFDIDASSHNELLELASGFDQVHFLAGVVDPHVRRTICDFAIEQGYSPFSVIAEDAYVAHSTVIGQGCFVAPQAVVSENAVLGDFSIVHFHASVGHDCRLGESCTILPGARISGEVDLGDRVLVGSNAFIYQGVDVGADTQIDALTYVRHDVDSGMLVSCSLAKPVRRPGVN